MVVKVQKAFNNKNILIYDKSRKYIWEGENQELSELLGGKLKSYFKAIINDKKQIELMDIAEDQKW